MASCCFISNVNVRGTTTIISMDVNLKLTTHIANPCHFNQWLTIITFYFF